MYERGREPDPTMTSAIAGHQANIYVIHNSGASPGVDDLEKLNIALGVDLSLRDDIKAATISPYGDDNTEASSVTMLAAQDIPLRDLSPIAKIEDEAEVFRRVREVNGRANGDKIPIPVGQRRFDSTQIIAAPNWQINSTMYVPPAGGGGPGKPRYEASERRNSTKFKWKLPTALTNFENTVGIQAEGNQTCPVNVFILDTLPPPETVKAWQARTDGHRLTTVLNAANLYWANDHHINLLPAVQREGHIEDLFCRMEPTPLDVVGSPWALNLPDDENISDHGIFIAGIIYAMNPNAKLHLIQVLNDAGAGTMRSLTQGLRLMSEIMKCPDNAKIPAVVNLSLAFCNPAQIIADAVGKRFPEQVKIWRELMGELGSALPDAELAKTAEKYFKVTIQPLDLIYQLAGAVLTTNTVFVAAAGNDGGKSPRYPATSDFVYGVGAVGKVRKIEGKYHKTTYSNSPPDNKPVEGAWAFGGNYKGEKDKENGILGISTMTSTGYAWWAGTSFATAAMSGMLARLIGAGKSAEESMTFLRDKCRQPNGTGAVSEPLVDMFQGNLPT